MPDYKTLFSSVGIEFTAKYPKTVDLGAWIKNKDNKWLIVSNPLKNSALYNAGLVKGDKVLSIDGKLTNDKNRPSEFFKTYQPGTEVKIVYNRFGNRKETILTLGENKSYKTFLKEDSNKEALKRQKNWLKAKKN